MYAKSVLLLATVACTAVLGAPMPADAPAAAATATKATPAAAAAAPAGQPTQPTQAQIQTFQKQAQDFQKQVQTNITKQFNPAQQKAIANAQAAIQSANKDGSDPTDAVSKALNAGGIDLKKDAFQGGISNEQRKTLGLGLGGFGGIGAGIGFGGGFAGGAFGGGGLGYGCVSSLDLSLVVKTLPLGRFSMMITSATILTLFSTGTSLLRRWSGWRLRLWRWLCRWCRWCTIHPCMLIFDAYKLLTVY